MSASTDNQYYFHRTLMPPMNHPSNVPHMYDRTQEVFPRPEIKCLTPIGDPKAEQLTIPVLMANRVQEILKAANGRKIAVSWSGGLDSTAVLCALMNVLAAADITVLMNQKSIDEYPLFYSTYIEGKMPIITMPEYAVEVTLNQCVLDGYVIVTGEIGDQMFGSIKYLEYEDQADLMKPWETVLNGLSTQSVDLYQGLVDACPVKMTTVKMFWWWFNYVIKYQGVQLRMMISAPDTRLNDNVFHFFDNAEWNNWCLYTDQEVRYPGTDPMQYKKPIKDYILACTDDQVYYDTKGKVRSLILYRGKLNGLHQSDIIDTNWTRT
jgi:hypothetical protein